MLEINHPQESIGKSLVMAGIGAGLAVGGFMGVGALAQILAALTLIFASAVIVGLLAAQRVRPVLAPVKVGIYFEPTVQTLPIKIIQKASEVSSQAQWLWRSLVEIFKGLIDQFPVLSLLEPRLARLILSSRESLLISLPQFYLGISEHSPPARGP